jgi:hypothetical protein
MASLFNCLLLVASSELCTTSSFTSAHPVTQAS